MKNLKEELKTIDPIVIPEPPMVRDTPEGWPSFVTMDGDTWYERALNFERWSGHPPLPSEFVYDDNWIPVPAEDYYRSHSSELTGVEV